MNINFENINWELLSKYLTREANDVEKEEFEKWLAMDIQNRVLFESLKGIDNERDIIKSVQKLDVERALRKLKKIKDKPGILNLSKLAKIAAILIVVIGISFILRHTLGTPKILVVDTKKGQRTEIVLSDGSTVYVNENSRFSYPKKFDGQNRKVKLTGEAYFKVTHNKTKPFIVDMDVVCVKVLGTEFDISNQQGAGDITVAVTKGSVQFGSIGTNTNSIVLKKGNAGKYNKQRQDLSFEKNYDFNSIAWKTKYLVFNNETLEEVANKLEEVYLIKIKVGEDLRSRRVSATYNNQPLKMIIQILESTLNVDINETGKNKYEIVSKMK